MHRICFPLFAAAIAFSTFAAGQVSAQTPASSTPPPTVYVKAGHLFDSTSDNLRENVVLVVEGERITKVAAAGDVTIPRERRWWISRRIGSCRG